MTTQTDTTPCLIPSTSIYGVASISAALGVASAPGSAVWPAANRAIVVPLALPFDYSIARAYVVNGAAVSGNFDIGIYDTTFARLGSTGATAQSGTNTVQFATLALDLVAGSYYMALAFDNGVGTTFRISAVVVQWLNDVGMLQQASAYPLPNPLPSPAVPASAYIPVFGITRTASGF